MSWWGKLVGGAFGYVLGGPLGALLGAALGHQFDKARSYPARRRGAEYGPDRRERTQTAFFTATFAVLGKLSKADGRVSHHEIALAEEVMARMDLGEELRKAAIDLFRQGKSPGFRLDPVLDQLRRECHRSQQLLRMFLEIQLHGAYADGRLDPAEERLLLHVCQRLGIPEHVLRQLEALVRAEREAFAQGGDQGAAPAPSRLEEAYAILGVPSDASDEQVTRAYRKLRSQHHPDKLISKGLPEEMMRVATEKSQEIRRAYELVMQSRGVGT